MSNKLEHPLLPTANSSMLVSDDEKKQIIEKAAEAYESFLDALRIDWRNDVNKIGRAHV